MKQINKTLLSITLLANTPVFAIDCERYWDYYLSSGKQFNVDAYLIKAICTKESRETPGAVNKKNSDKSIDVGACQINSFWKDKFEKEFGIPMSEVKNSAKTAIFASGYVLSYNFSIKGRNMNSIGAYNAGWLIDRQNRRDSYAKEVLSLRNEIYKKCKRADYRLE